MARSKSRYPVLLDWINVSYRSVIVSIILVVTLVAAAGGYWYHHTRIRPRNEASDTIFRATQRLGEAEKLATEERARQAVANAGAALDEVKAAVLAAVGTLL